jgi:DTW domain-containing protein
MNSRQRTLCFKCLQPLKTCFCGHLRPFNSHLRFVILIHPLETRRRIATGRMSYLTLQNSHLIRGYDFSNNLSLNELLKDPAIYPVVLYPGKTSTNLSTLSDQQRGTIFPEGRQPMIIVIDGTWGTAGKMLRRSGNLVDLPRICFTPPHPSNFRVRQQPKSECFSTIEAIHHVIELVGGNYGFDRTTRAHDSLLYVFDKMVEQQLEFVRHSKALGKSSRHTSTRH